jgi:phospholipid/cholesterol/gamma-HCH transport system permease protein
MEKRTQSIFLTLGDAGYKFYQDLISTLIFMGELLLAMLYALTHPRKVRWRDTFYYMDSCGSDALPIVSLLSILIGIILGVQAILQLSQFGVNSFVIDLVSVSMVRELGPLVVAIIIAGRSGSAFAAEIGTMKASEELDAMITMGFVPSRFVVVPKVIGLVAVMPLLTIFSDIWGVIGGIIVAHFQLDMAAVEGINRAIDVLSPVDFLQSFVKSLVFAGVITVMGCMRGMEASRDAQGVGRASTSAVVSSIFLIIVLDAIVTTVFYVLTK